MLFLGCDSINQDCFIPKEIEEFVAKNLIKIYSQDNLIKDWKSNPKMNFISCPTLVNEDITNDGKKDFITIIDLKDEEGDLYPAIVCFKNYESNLPLNPVKIAEVKDYEKSIGTAIYLMKEKNQTGIAVYNFESSLSFIYFKNGKFNERYLVD